MKLIFDLIYIIIIFSSFSQVNYVNIVHWGITVSKSNGHLNKVKSELNDGHYLTKTLALCFSVKEVLGRLQNYDYLSNLVDALSFFSLTFYSHPFAWEANEEL